MLTITTNSFENDVLHADKPVLVDFCAQWRSEEHTSEQSPS